MGRRAGSRRGCRRGAALAPRLAAALLSLAPHTARPEEPPAAVPSPAGPAEPGGAPATLEQVRTALGLSGFLDVQAADPRTDPNVLSMGDLEVDLARELGTNVQVAAALVANGDGARLGVGFVDVHLFGGLVAPRGRLPVEKGFHVQLGRFDVGFGNDWRYYAARDRTELSPPLTTEAVLEGGLNDVGLRVVGNNGSLDYGAYVLRGTGTGPALGGRLAVLPFDNPYRLHGRVHALELGVSALVDLDGHGGTDAAAVALDAELRGPLGRLRAEWVRRDARPAAEGADRDLRSGWHLTAILEAGALGGVTLSPYLRYDSASVDGDRTDRLTAGLHATLLEAIAVKAEYQRLLSAPAAAEAEEGFHRDSLLAQVVVSF